VEAKNVYLLPLSVENIIEQRRLLEVQKINPVGILVADTESSKAAVLNLILSGAGIQEPFDSFEELEKQFNTSWENNSLKILGLPVEKRSDIGAGHVRVI